jgi:hypothetical protein
MNDSFVITHWRFYTIWPRDSGAAGFACRYALWLKAERGVL